MGSGCWILQLKTDLDSPSFRACLERECGVGFWRGAIGVHYGKVSFFVVEPQQSDGSTAVLCSWTQKTLQPVVPDWCKEKVTMDYFQKAFECGVRYEFEVWDPKEYNSEISRQDKAGGDPASKP
jgi:hypothetical protein